MNTVLMYFIREGLKKTIESMTFGCYWTYRKKFSGKDSHKGIEATNPKAKLNQYLKNKLKNIEWNQNSWKYQKLVEYGN